MTQHNHPPAMRSWIFMLSRVQPERGGQNKLPLCSSKSRMEQVCIHFLLSEIQAHCPSLNLLTAHTDVQWQVPELILALLESGRTGNTKGTLSLQSRRLSEELIAKTLCTNDWKQELTGVLGFIPLSSGKRSISGQRKLITFFAIIFFKETDMSFWLNRNMSWQMQSYTWKVANLSSVLLAQALWRMWKQNSWVVFKCNILQESDTMMQIDFLLALSLLQLFPWEKIWQKKSDPYNFKAP